LLLLAAVAGSAQASGCTKSEREGLASYLCQLDSQGSAPAFRLEFHRLSEAVIGDLVTNTDGHIVSNVLGRPKIIETNTGTELAALYRNFATSETLQSAFFVRMTTPDKPDVEKAAEPGMGQYGEGTRRMTYITNPDTEGLVEMDFPLPETVQEVQSNDGWPDDIKLFYGCDPNDYFNLDEDPNYVFSCSSPWRYMSAADPSSYEDNLRRFRDMITDVYQRQYYENPRPNVMRYLGLVRHITRNGFPQDLIPIVGTFDICGGSFDFGFYPRLLELDVAVIENLTSETLVVQDLLGISFDRMDLRLEESAAAGTSSVLPVAVGGLAPGERALVPVRMTFVQSNSLTQRFQNIDGAQRFYDRLMGEPADRVLRSSTEFLSVSKRASSFRPPERPSTATYVYGPELQITGLVVAGEQINLAESSANYLELTAGEGYGSCPYLYYWSATGREWITFGKVIDDANLPEKARTEIVRLARPTTRLRIAENELEVSYIDEVALILELERGQTLLLKPEIAALRSVDRAHIVLDAHQFVDLEFKLPAGVTEDDMISSKASINGYYRRYSAFRLSKLGAN
jgi:hypothetical protein